MTISLLPNRRNLDLCAKAIETQHDLARIELFRPFDVFDRFQGIGPKEFGLEGRDVQRLLDHRNERVELVTGDRIGHPGETREIAQRLAPFEALIERVMAITDEAAKADVYRNTARYNGQSIQRYSVRVTICWRGRQHTREYVLPGLGKDGSR